MATHQFHQIANLLEKMTSTDKDFRFMATNDLMSELQKDSIKLDDESERKIVRMVLRLLEDKNGEVQNLAVKCLGPLVNKVKEGQVEMIVDSLCANMVSNSEQLRDISSIGLKTVISELPQTSSSLAPNVCQRITGKLSSAIENKDVSVQLEALDILTDLLSRFGDLLVPFHETVLKALVPQLASQRQAVRKRTIVALSHLLITCSGGAYGKVITHLLEGLEKRQGAAMIRTYIQCLAAICRQSGFRLCAHIDRAMVLLVEFSQCDDDELREFCLQACEAFVLRCPQAIGAHIPTIVELCLSYITYDPNYNYEADDGAEEDGSAPMDTEDDDDGSTDEYSDDDDMSWKVRRSAAKCLEAVIATRPELLEEFYRSLAPALIVRFKEREENVKSDIFHAYIALLRQTRTIDDGGIAALTAAAAAGIAPNAAAVAALPPSNGESREHITAPIALLLEQVPSVVRAVQPLMREKSVKTRQDCFLLLRELLHALPGAFTHHIHQLIPGIQYSLNDKNTTSNMKIDALGFVCFMLQTHNPQIFHPHIQVLVPLVVAAVFDVFYKIATEALLVLQHLVRVVRPLDLECTFEFQHFVGQLYECTLQKLRSQEADQEVKERAIACMGQIIANMGDVLKAELNTCLPIFLDRLRNEVTRLSAVKALTMIAASPLRVDLSVILADVIPALGTFLRKNQRPLKLNALQLLDTLVQNYSACIEAPLLQQAIVEIPPLLSESDLHVAQLSLVLCTSIAAKQPAALYGVYEPLLPEIMFLVRSPLLQGAALQCTLKLFKALVYARLPGLGHRQLLDMLKKPIVAQTQGLLHKQAYHSTARCVAALVLEVPAEAVPLAGELLQEILGGLRNDSHLVFCLLTIGEIGRHFNLSAIAALPECIIECFSASSEEVKAAASYALGAIAVGDLNYYLPFVLAEIEAQPKRQYLLLHSLKELITSLSQTAPGLQALMPNVPAIWEQLFRHCECSEEGSRNVVAECLGKLVLVQPDELLPRLQAALQSESALMRTAVVSAVKFTISDQPQAIDALLRQTIGQFLYALQDPEPAVRRVALVAFNSAVHNKPSLVRELLPGLLPSLYSETKVKKELIREVEMGPFKHTVDDGLDIRKAAFECMYTLLEQGLERVDIGQFLEHVQTGLKDHYDIKMLTYLMTARLAVLCPGAMLQKLDSFVDPLHTTCTLKVKANSVKQEYEKQDELKRSALRAVAALVLIPKAEKNQKLAEFLKVIKESADLVEIFKLVQKDAAANCAASTAAGLGVAAEVQLGNNHASMDQS